jgi:Putative MetA-pathway of phenol degradation
MWSREEAMGLKRPGCGPCCEQVSFLCVAATLVLLLMPGGGSAQELEPGAYWPIPKGLSIVTAVNSFNWGDVAFDPSAPIDEASATINTTALSFTRAFSLAGRSANAGVMLPVIGGHLEGLYLGEPAAVGRFGLGDPRLRLAMNLYGAPAMTPKEFASYRQRTIVGVSVTVAPPLGQYDPSKLINLGTNRWSIKPELGVSRAYGRWVVEAMAGVWLFTDNTDFLGGRTREQEPITATQVHMTFKFTRSMWLAADANYFTGGQTTIGGQQNLDFQRNSRIGATFSSALGRRQAIRMSVSRGAYTTIGADFTSIAVGYNYAWTR